MTGGKDLKPLAVDNSNPIDDATERRENEEEENGILRNSLFDPPRGAIFGTQNENFSFFAVEVTVLYGSSPFLVCELFWGQ